MRKIILSTVAAIAALTSTSAFAAGTASVNVSSTLAQSCSISTDGSTVTLTGTTAASTPVTVTCNFTGTPTIAYTSANKGVKGGEGGELVVDYLINYGGTPAPGNLLASIADGGPAATFNANPVTPNSPNVASLSFALVAAPTVAGTYSDTLTLTVAP